VMGPDPVRAAVLVATLVPLEWRLVLDARLVPFPGLVHLYAPNVRVVNTSQPQGSLLVSSAQLESIVRVGLSSVALVLLELSLQRLVLPHAPNVTAELTVNPGGMSV
jgi:hypothetical protein